MTAYQLASSDVFEIQKIPNGGRSIISKLGIERGTLLLSTSQYQSPIAHVVLRPYRKEVCHTCFAYDRGRAWKLRLAEAGVCFCSEKCQHAWLTMHDDVCLTAYRTVQQEVKRLQSLRPRLKEEDLLTKHAALLANLVYEDRLEFENNEWIRIEGLAHSVRCIRDGGQVTRQDRNTLISAKNTSVDTDTLWYILSGVISAYQTQQRMPSTTSLDLDTRQKIRDTYMCTLLTLEDDDKAFFPKCLQFSILEDYQNAYLLLLATLPLEMLQFCTQCLVVNLGSRASHNAFSIRPEGDVDGRESGEFLGWGIWPEASFFNHSCLPNVRKDRKGRLWHFSTDINVSEGDQLCISYLGGDEKDLNVLQRRKRLQDQWNFLCCCTRCIYESKEGTRS